MRFEHTIVPTGDEIRGWEVDEAEWIAATIDAVSCDHAALTAIFDRCIGQPIA